MGLINREGLIQMNEFASSVSGNVEILLSGPVLGNNSSPSYADVTKKKEKDNREFWFIRG